MKRKRSNAHLEHCSPGVTGEGEKEGKIGRDYRYAILPHSCDTANPAYLVELQAPDGIGAIHFKKLVNEVHHALKDKLVCSAYLT